MGSNASKPNGEAAVQVHVQKNEDVGDNFDPRSPTPEIVRTPLHVSSFISCCKMITLAYFARPKRRRWDTHIAHCPFM